LETKKEESPAENLSGQHSRRDGKLIYEGEEEEVVTKVGQWREGSSRKVTINRCSNVRCVKKKNRTGRGMEKKQLLSKVELCREQRNPKGVGGKRGLTEKSLEEREKERNLRKKGDIYEI